MAAAKYNPGELRSKIIDAVRNGATTGPEIVAAVGSHNCFNSIQGAVKAGLLKRTGKYRSYRYSVANAGEKRVRKAAKKLVRSKSARSAKAIEDVPSDRESMREELITIAREIARLELRMRTIIDQLA